MENVLDKAKANIVALLNKEELTQAELNKLDRLIHLLATCYHYVNKTQ